MRVPQHPKIYHIVHMDRLPSIISDGFLWSDAEISQRSPQGTTIGMSSIKRRRLEELTLDCYPDLRVGECVPFYFCPRSIMLFIIHCGNSDELTYRGGQNPIVHLEADLQSTVEWAGLNSIRWSFTLSNAGAYYCEFRNNLTDLNDLDWNAIQTTKWGGLGVDPSIKESKQSEFLIENAFPWHLLTRIGVRTEATYQRVVNTLPSHGHRPDVVIKPEWYY